MSRLNRERARRDQIMPSSVIKQINYNHGDEQLTITFQSGAVSRYYGVPEDVYTGFRIARSKGRYLNRYIISRYPFERIAKG
ncbi:KTSC domain-containing protein [Parapedobacter lycopersici]|uniref:KTSC domain-containing protein n=1 Tax=Parapedobacter lycopersici TaxID=1864939 RepID=UPI00214D99F5|nr:KTSC domain-containing protein [Parapedobacter lycopersici]